MARKETLLVTTGAIFLEDDSASHDDCVYYVGGLGAGETVAVQHNIGGTWEQVYNYQGSTNDAAIFTGSGGTPVSVNSMVLRGGLYRFVGADPAGTVTIERLLGRVVNER